MNDLLILGGSSFVFTLILTPLFRNLFRLVGAVDLPDKDRKLHSQPVPHMGGVPIVVAYLCSFLLASHFGMRGIANLPLLVKVTPAAAIIFAVGLLDDWLGLNPLEKLGAQLIAGVMAYSAGVQISGFAGHHLAHWLSMPVTILWLIACSNAFNLIDGLDGLAAGVGLFATATTLIAALIGQNMDLALATAPLVGALIGFLRYNFNPATIFLGDSGSLLIGFLLGCFGVFWSQKSYTMLGMTAPLMALSIPILDASLAIVRRFLRNQPIMSGDRGHIHHRLLDRGLSPRKAVLLLYGLCGIGAVFSLFSSVATNHYSAAAVLVFCGVAWIGIQNLGYAEFGEARRMILAGGFRAALNSQLALQSLCHALSEADSRERSWEVLRSGLHGFGFAEARWVTGGLVFHDELESSKRSATWELRVPLSGGDYVEFKRAVNAPPLHLNVGTLAEALRSSLVPLRPAEESEKQSLVTVSGQVA